MDALRLDAVRLICGGAGVLLGNLGIASAAGDVFEVDLGVCASR